MTDVLMILAVGLIAAEPAPPQPPSLPGRPPPVASGSYSPGQLGCSRSEHRGDRWYAVHETTIMSGQRLAVSMHATDFSPLVFVRDDQNRIVGAIQGVAGAPPSGVVVQAPVDPDAPRQHRVVVVVSSREAEAKGAYKVGFGSDGDLVELISSPYAASVGAGACD